MKQECLEMNKMEPATNINLPPTLLQDCHCHNQCVFFYTLVFYYHFSSHSWYAWSCLPQSSQHWSKSKSGPVRDCTTAAHAKKQSTLRKGRIWCGLRNQWWYGCWWATVSVQLARKWHMVFSMAQFQTRLLPAFFRSSWGSAWWPSYCWFLVLSLLMPVGFIFTLWPEKLFTYLLT